MGEFDLIRRIRRDAPGHESVVLGIGDDCAILGPQPSGTLVTTDMLLEGRHFRLAECTPEDVGFKAMAVNLSDIAAMAGIPVAAFVSAALPRRNAESIAISLQRGLNEAASRYGVALAGGDTNVWDGPLVVNVTLVGRVSERGPLRRSGAVAGDHVYVTGPLGGSILGRHLKPLPRVREALRFHRLLPITAMIDVSDGLASDLGHILEESGGFGAILEEALIPIHPDAHALSKRDGRSALDHAMTDGEDFELAFTATTDVESHLDDEFEPDLNPPILVGVVSASPGLFLRRPDGELVPYRSKGFDHFAS